MAAVGAAPCKMIKTSRANTPVSDKMNILKIEPSVSMRPRIHAFRNLRSFFIQEGLAKDTLEGFKIIPRQLKKFLPESFLLKPNSVKLVTR